jgi:hypothetical protein
MRSSSRGRGPVSLSASAPCVRDVRACDLLLRDPGAADGPAGPPGW